MEHGLTLAAPTFEVSLLAVLLDRRDVPRDRAPSANLPRVVGGSTTHVVAAVPLEPAARILRPDPALAPPDRERLRGVDAKTIEPRIVPGGTELRACEPARREFIAAVRHVLAAEHPELQHLL